IPLPRVEGPDGRRTHRHRQRSALQALRRLPYLLHAEDAPRGLGGHPKRLDAEGEDRPVRRRPPAHRPRVAARAGRLLVRHRRRVALALAPVRAPSHRHLLRAAVAALRALHGEERGAARVRHARLVARRREGEGIRVAHVGDHARLPRGGGGGHSRRGRPLRAPERRSDQLPDHGQLRRAAAHRRPAPLYPRAVGDTADGGEDARRADAQGPRAGEVSAAQVRRAADGLLRRGAEGLRELPALRGEAPQAPRAGDLQEASRRDAEPDEGPERERLPRRGGVPRAAGPPDLSKRTAFELPIGLRAALPIAACLLLAAALSWARDILAGSLGLDTRSLPVGYRIWPFVAFGVLAAIAGRRFLQVLRSTPRYPWPHLLAGAFAIHLAALPALPLTSSDLFSHLSYARLSQLGKNPYRTGPAALPQSAFVFLAWNPLFAWEISGQAHSEGLVLVGLLVFVWAALRSREWLAVLGASCAVLSKIVLLPLLGLYLCFVARRRPLRALAMAGAAAALGVALVAPWWDGPGTLQGPLATLVANDTLTARSLTDFGLWVLRPLGADSQHRLYRVAVALGPVLLAGVGLRAVMP